ncbi:TIMELESS-interacting protein [Danaus plexippus]|uniref:TIMELESS-interacting protein n=1 Tax=Danaus plexippus TaxID=13037 RepID=UPI002AB06CC3|nr:TIMELESS-interacting protein [Danaus plexippus]
MSLLEDVFLRDEADEAQELERVIEGDEYEDRLRHRSDSDNDSERSDEAEEDKRKVDPASTKIRRIIKNPRFVLNPARLTGPRGIHVIPEHFKDFKFKGKGHEKEDLDLILKKLEHWAYRLYPKFQFEDCLKKIETLGKKRPVMVNLHKIRSDQFTTEEPIVQRDSTDDDEPQDEFDKLLQQQIDLARAAEAKTDETHSPVRSNKPLSPKATSSPSISDEQKERMLRNRRLAEERRKNRILANSVTEEVTPALNEDNDNHNKVEEDLDTNISRNKKINRSNVIDSSDEDICVVNESFTVDIHNGTTDNGRNSEENVTHNENCSDIKDKDEGKDMVERGSTLEHNPIDAISGNNDLENLNNSETLSKDIGANGTMDVDFDV